MASRRSRRNQEVSNGHIQNERRDISVEQLCDAVLDSRLIPVIGDTIRLGHIFDLDRAQSAGSSVIDTAVANSTRVRHSIVEDLATWWAEDIRYPLTDSNRLARVAQFHAIEMGNEVVAKKDYLRFLKRELLNNAADMAEDESDLEMRDLVESLRSDPYKSFAQIVMDLEFPRFPAGREDPLQVLAQLPIRVFLTTSPYDFIEQALSQRDKRPVSRLCFWNSTPENVAPEHQPSSRFMPSVSEPVVYHLFGMEQYPESMVLSEDDYLRFIWRLARDKPGDSGDRMIPPYLEAELNVSSLLLLGYSLEDWDLRVLLHGLLNVEREARTQRLPSVAIQIDPEEQPLVDKSNVAAAQDYLSKYFRRADFGLRFQDSDEFVSEFWHSWQARWKGGSI